MSEPQRVRPDAFGVMPDGATEFRDRPSQYRVPGPPPAIKGTGLEPDCLEVAWRILEAFRQRADDGLDAWGTLDCFAFFDAFEAEWLAARAAEPEPGSFVEESLATMEDGPARWLEALKTLIETRYLDSQGDAYSRQWLIWIRPRLLKAFADYRAEAS